ncbi:MAG: menaquinone-dependent protoporphyrinogen IX dehydrogenase [Bdellovibrio sp.]
MARILVVYESKYGQTKKISSFILDRLQSKGHTGDLVDLVVNSMVDPTNYDGVIVGSGIYGRRYPQVVQKWVKAQSRVLNNKPSAFFSVCLAILDKSEKAQVNTKDIENNLLSKTSWSPRMKNIFAGALNYSKYGWFTKQMMRLIAKSEGSDTDVSRDYEYTNWSDVTRFSEDFIKLLPLSKERGAPLSP